MRRVLYKTTDYGKTWTKIDNGIPGNAFTRVVREDEVRKDLLFAGTELGVFVSWNGGRDWSKFQMNLPVTPITDLRVHRGNLIAATSGRSFWILDDLSLLRQYKTETTPVSIYQPSDAYIGNGGSELDFAGADFDGASRYRGVNPASGVVIYYRLPELKKTDDITLEIRDSAGKLIRSYTSSKENSFEEWDGGPDSDPTASKIKRIKPVCLEYASCDPSRC